MKICNKCGVEKKLSEFYKGKRNKDGYMPYCKECRNKQVCEWKLNNKEKIQKTGLEWYTNNRERKLKCCKQRYNNNQEQILKINRQWKQNNPDKVKGHKAKRKRNLGFNPLNTKFPGSVGHHLDLVNVLYIPEEIHKSISHSVLRDKNMEIINKFALESIVGSSMR